MPQVFISHSNSDKIRFVTPLAEELKSLGVKVWIDDAELRPGDDLVERIFTDGLGKSDVVVVVLSSISLESRWVGEELNISVIRRLKHNLKIIPIVLDGVDPPVSLSHLFYLKANEHSVREIARKIADVVFNLPTSIEHLDEPPIVKYKPRIRGLEKIDELFFRLICDEVLSGTGHPYIDRETFIEFSDVNGISEDRLEESLASLEHSYYIECRNELGSRLPFAVKPTDYGFRNYLEQYYPHLEEAIKEVAASILNDSQFTDIQIADKRKIPIFLVDHILNEFESSGHLKLVHAIDGTYIHPLPTLRRMLV